MFLTNQIERWKTIYNEYPKTFWMLVGISGSIPFALGPLLAGLVMDNSPDPRVLWYVVGGIGVLATLGFLWLHGKVDEPSVDVDAILELV